MRDLYAGRMGAGRMGAAPGVLWIVTAACGLDCCAPAAAGVSPGRHQFPRLLSRRALRPSAWPAPERPVPDAAGDLQMRSSEALAPGLGSPPSVPAHPRLGLLPERRIRRIALPVPETLAYPLPATYAHLARTAVLVTRVAGVRYVIETARPARALRQCGQHRHPPLGCLPICTRGTRNTQGKKSRTTRQEQPANQESRIKTPPEGKQEERR